jgi:hypothetical protein
VLPKSPNHTSPLITFPHSLSSNSCWSCFPAISNIASLQSPPAYAANRDLYAWQIGMPPEACARESEAHERPYGASVRALEELAPCRRKQGRHRSFPSPSFSSCLAQTHSAEPSGNLGHLNALPSWPPSPGPCAPVRAPKSTVPSRLLPRSSTCGRGQAHFSRRRVRRSKNLRQNCATGPWYPLRRPQ